MRPFRRQDASSISPDFYTPLVLPRRDPRLISDLPGSDRGVVRDGMLA
jgi:hypothetical protein